MYLPHLRLGLPRSRLGLLHFILKTCTGYCLLPHICSKQCDYCGWLNGWPQ